jgi:hypothetical protein
VLSAALRIAAQQQTEPVAESVYPRLSDLHLRRPEQKRLKLHEMKTILSTARDTIGETSKERGKALGVSYSIR